MKAFHIIILLMATTVQAAEYYVAKDGNDANPGSLSQPWRTIEKAASTLMAGDTVFIRGGTYKERVVPKRSGTTGKPITYTAYQNENATIDGSGIRLPTDWGGLLDISKMNYIHISGLRITNAGPHYNNPGILVDNSGHVTLAGNTISNTVSSGIGVWNSHNITIDNNDVTRCCNDGEQECITIATTRHFAVKNNHVHHGGPGTAGGEGIDVKDGSSHGKIYNNHVHHLNRLGIYVDSWDKQTSNIEVFNNTVHDIKNNDGFALASESGGLLKQIRLYNNIAYNNGACGLTISRNGDSARHPMFGIQILHNTFYNNGRGSWGGGIAVDNPHAQNVVIRNNILSQNLLFQIEIEPDVSIQSLVVDHNLIHGFRGYGDEIKGDQVIEGDPLFLNPTTVDFHLQQNSIAIDAASHLLAPTYDKDGRARPQGNGFDVGAYEYSGSRTDIH